MIVRLEHTGRFPIEISIPGERRADGSAPAHVNGIQLSRNRILLLISTLSFRGVDDSRGILYQIRDGAFDGAVVREGTLAQSIDDWDPIGDGRRYVRQYGHPVAFGVPRGALVKGKPAPNANVFVIKWRICVRELHPDGYLLWGSQRREVHQRTQGVEWIQVRLNPAEDDLEIVQAPRALRQKGFEESSAYCAANVSHMNQTFVQAVPFSDDCAEWVDVNHFNAGFLEQEEPSLLAALRYRFNPNSRLYDWVQTGPLFGKGCFEASIARYNGSWIIAGRPQNGGPVGWARTDDPFKGNLEMACPEEPYTHSPISAYACPDGAIRLFSGAPKISPYGKKRNPLYCWQIDPDNKFSCSDRRVILDVNQSNIRMTEGHHPIVDMCKLMHHTGGRTQQILHRVRTGALRNNDPAYGNFLRMTDDDFAATGVYAAQIGYAEDYPAFWQF